MRGYFITGTDTNVGKTYVTSGLARRAVALGQKVFAFKPIETGCEPGPDSLVGLDQEALAAAAGNWQTGPARGLYRFPLPAAPSVAAVDAGAPPVDLALIVSTARSVATAAAVDLTLVEGAGGWRVPVTDEADMGALAKALALPVVVVARAGLGTINHTLLTLEAIERDGLAVAAVVMSQLPSEPAPFSNRAEILRRWPGNVVILRDDLATLDPLIA